MMAILSDDKIQCRFAKEKQIDFFYKNFEQKLSDGAQISNKSFP